MTTTSTLGPENRLRDVAITGNRLRAHLAKACVSASLSASMSQVTEMSFTFADDEDLTIFRSGVLQPGQTIRYGRDTPWMTRITQGPELDLKGDTPRVSTRSSAEKVERLRGATGGHNFGSMSVSSFVRARCNEISWKHHVEPGLTSREIIREEPDGDSDKDHNTWDIFTELASELGVWCFEYGDTLVFGRPSWVASRPGRRTLSYRWTKWGDYSDGFDGKLGFKGWARENQELTIGVVGTDADSIRPGDTLNVSGNLGRATGDWVIIAVKFPLTRTAATQITCRRAVL